MIKVCNSHFAFRFSVCVIPKIILKNHLEIYHNDT